MDQNKRNEIEEKVKNCKLKIANEQAKLARYLAQLETGKSGHTKPKKKPEQKQGKAAVKPDQNPPKTTEEKGFFETIFS